MGEQRAEAPGWDAIDAALNGVYGEREPLHFAGVPHRRSGGSQPLDGISAFHNDDPPHWHFVTYGLSELYGKESDDPKVSGWGFELTLRLACVGSDAQPPTWPMNFLQNLARYVFQTRNPFGPGQQMSLNGPIALGLQTRIEALTFVPDPRLAAIETPNGRVAFLQVVGLTADEKQAMEDWSTDAWLELLSARDPLLLTDLGRTSLLEDPNLARSVREGIERDGSSQDLSYVARLDWRAESGVELVLGATAVASLQRMARSRVPYGREFELMGPGKAVVFRPAPAAAWSAEDEELVVDVSPALAHEILSTLRPQRGLYTSAALPGFVIRVNPTEIRDGEGRVVRTIG
jgi:hypothetical protein